MQLAPTKSEVAKALLPKVRAELIKRGALEASTVIGIVSPNKGLTHCIKKQKGVWVKTIDLPEVYLPQKLEKALTSSKRFIVIMGGRGSAKSVGGVDICLIDGKDTGAKTYFLREYQSSIKQSVHNLIKSEIERLEFDGFDVRQTSIEKAGEEIFAFSGIARNTDSIKSAHGFKRFLVEEAQFMTSESLDALTPTLRNKPNKGLPKRFSDEITEIVSDPGVSLMFLANPGSSEDPFSQRFIVPFQDKLDRDGIYEDEMHLIIKMNHDDNPWFDESGLEIERAWDYENRSRALYDHIWLGAMNDSVDNALVMSEWFDACIDAHLRLGFKPQGAIIASHDPSDMGPDSKGYVLRHGNVFLDIQEKDTGDVNEGGHWAANLAIAANADYFTWDCDGMGAALSEQMSSDFEGKATQVVMFKGSESPDNEKMIYSPAVKAPIENSKTIGETFYNKRAQYYFDFRDRCYRTYRAVVLGEYFDPDSLISFSSDIKLLNKFRSELCRMPIKPNTNGLLTLYTKVEMKAKFKINSPNLSDSGMMSLRYTPKTEAVEISFKRKW